MGGIKLLTQSERTLWIDVYKAALLLSIADVSRVWDDADNPTLDAESWADDAVLALRARVEVKGST